jgi:hypothetical protein
MHPLFKTSQLSVQLNRIPEIPAFCVRSDCTVNAYVGVVSRACPDRLRQNRFAVLPDLLE